MISSNAELLPGSAQRADRQTWTSSCEPSVRCVWSQWGGCTLIIASLPQHRFCLSVLLITHMPVDHLSNGFLWSTLSRLLPVVRFVSAGLKRISSRHINIRLRGSCVLSCPNGMCQWDSSTLDNASHVCLNQTLRRWPEFTCSNYSSFGTKPELLHRCHPIVHYPQLSADFKADRDWFSFLLVLCCRIHNKYSPGIFS